jgi:ribosomal protein S18 acetylase RimI-like enzyme
MDDSNIERASNLAQCVFKDDVPTPEESFRASLYPERYKLLWQHYDLTYLKYWVMYHPHFEHEVIGTVGIYSLMADEVIADWVGWLCVDRTRRRRGAGTLLMNFIMERMKERGKKIVKLYVDNHADAAQQLYKKLGFYRAGTGKDPGGSTILYFERAL